MGVYFQGNPLQTAADKAAKAKQRQQADAQQRASQSYTQDVSRLGQLEQSYAQNPGRMEGGTGTTGLTPTDETGYRNMLGERVEYQQLQNRLAGKPSAMRYAGGGTIGSEGGGMPGPALKSLSKFNGDEQDPLARSAAESEDELLRQQVLRGRDQFEDENRKEAERATAALYTPANDLFTGRTAAATRAAGDITRDEEHLNAAAKRREVVPDAAEAGAAEAAKYGGFGQDEARRNQFRDVRVRAPYAPSVYAADTRNLGTAYTADQRTSQAALQALARLAGTPQFNIAPDEAARAQAMEAVMPNVPGQQAPAPDPGTQRFPLRGQAPAPAPAAPQAPGASYNPGGQSYAQPAGPPKVFPANRLADFAQRMGFASPQAAKEYLQLQNYQVQ